jgi:hypothetical protein
MTTKNKKNEKKQKKPSHWEKFKVITPIVISTISLGLSVTTCIQVYNEKSNEKSIEEKLQYANSRFEISETDTIELLKAFNIYKELIKEKPSNLTGYNNFLNLAIKRRDILEIECDFWIKWYLQHAQEIYDCKQVQNLLKQCKE